MRPPLRVGRRAWSACSNASRTKPACAVRDARQPTIRRAKVSMTNATWRTLPRSGRRSPRPTAFRCRRVDLPVDPVQRARRRAVTDRGAHRLAPDHAGQLHRPHQPGHRAASHIKAFAPQLPPDLAHTIHAEVGIEHAPHFDPERGVPPCSIRQLCRIVALGHMRMIGR